MIGLRNPQLFKSISAFSPISNPTNCAWGIKALTGYLGKVFLNFRIFLILYFISFFWEDNPHLKQAMIDINGFDEELGNSAYASDTDLEWRFKGVGYNIISAKYIANQFHLFHKRKNGIFERGMLEKIKKNQENKKFYCSLGLNKINI